MERILITGALGLVGTGIRPVLRKENELVLLSRRAPDHLAENEFSTIGDVADRKAVFRACEGCTGVILLAASYGVNISFEETLDANYRGTINVLDAAVEAGAKHVIFASSNHGWGFYEKKQIPVSDLAPPRPDGWYGISKIWGEAAMAYYADAYGLSTTSLRIGNTSDAVADERRTHMWMSYSDMAGLMAACLKRNDGRHQAFFATTECAQPYFDNSGVAASGFVPKDLPMNNLATDFNPRRDDHDRIGGAFVAANMFRKEKE